MEILPDTNLFCFKHCRDAAVQFYTSSTQPSACKYCGQALSLGCTMEPFQVPCPWYTGQALRPGTVLLKIPHCRTQAHSSEETLLNRGYCLGEEQLQKQLIGSLHSSQLQHSHIGITDGSGSVYHFNHEGLRLDHLGPQDGPRSWHGALLVEIGGGSPYNQKIIGEVVAKAVKLSVEWSAERYCPKTHNCLDFVIAILNELVARTANDCGANCKGTSFTNDYDGVKGASFTRERIARQLLVPALERSRKYLRILKIARTGTSLELN